MVTGPHALPPGPASPSQSTTPQHRLSDDTHFVPTAEFRMEIQEVRQKKKIKGEGPPGKMSEKLTTVVLNRQIINLINEQKCKA